MTVPSVGFSGLVLPMVGNGAMSGCNCLLALSYSGGLDIRAGLMFSPN